MSRSEQKYQKVLKMISDEYRKAQESTWVRKPMAYALYQVWKWFDQHEKPRSQQESDGV